MRYAIRAIVAVGLLVGFYAMAAALVVGLGWAVVAVERHGPDLAAGKLLILVLPVVAAVGYAVFGRPPRGSDPGLLLQERDQPRLWALARELADLASTRCVDEIRLVADANAAVSDSATWLGLRPGTRRLYLGVPLLLGLDEAQLRSVLAHEFGHYSGRHTALSSVTYRGAEALRRIHHRLGPRHLVGRLFRAYAVLYFAVSHTVNRRQEFEADELSARVVGSDTAATALLEVRRLVLLWERYGALFGSLGQHTNQRPTRLLMGFADYAADDRVRRWSDEVLEALDEPKPTIYDTHPPIGLRVSRLRAAGRPGFDGTLTDRAPASDVLDDLEPVLAELEEDLYQRLELEPVPLPELASGAGGDELMRRARAIDALLREQGRAPGLATLHQSLRSGTATLLFQRHLAADADLGAATASLLGDYLGAALVSTGHARARLDWRSGWELVDPAGEPLELPDLVGEVLADPHRAEDLRELLRLHGVEDGWRPDQPAPEATRPATGAGRVLGIISPVNLTKTLVVTDREVMLLTPTLRDRLAVAARMNGREAQPLLERYSPLSADELAQSRKGRSVDWQSVSTLHLQPRSRRRARITVSGGDADLVVAVHKHSQEAGLPWEAAQHFLEERYVVEGRDLVRT
ncbi:M48 family metalloprotease [Nocardioides sp. SYSU DS0651]|uniref:M48 family metalloprotease n=1 Tax=Nocardioides sp. SYSU DS0651 TaxID=3415955 RepID=UPI003F4BD562